MSAKRRAPKTLRGRYDRSKSPEERQREQYDRLLDAARDLLAEHGWGKVTVDMILKLSTLSRATFYAHFKDIEDVLNHAYVRASERAVRIVAGEAVDPAERLRQGLFSFLELVRSNPRWARVMLEGGRGAPAQVVALQEAAYERWIEQILARSQEAFEAGRISRMPDEQTVWALVSAMHGVALRYLRRGEADRVMEAGPALLRLFVRAMT